MAAAKKLPSGSWRCLVYDYTDQLGKRHYKSFTSNDPTAKGKREAERMAANYAYEKESKSHSTLTFGEALNKYIADRESVLSAATIREYKRTKRTDLSEFENIKIENITQEYIQEFINDKAKNKAPKTVRNVHGLISAVLSQYCPDMRLTTVLPKKVRPDLYIPSDSEIKRLMQHITGTEMELPILLAAFGPMRRGEIAALTMDNIVGNRVHVCKNMVLNDERRWIIKQPKSYAGDRFIDYPDFVAEKWQGITGNITDLNPNIITSRFWHILKNAGLPHFRFHDLRHYSASIQHALGIPDAYIMQRGGWQTDGVLKAVYRHAMNDRQTEMNNIANAHFSDLCNTKCNT